MRYMKYFAGCALVMGILAAITPTVLAQDWRYYPQPDQYQYEGQGGYYGNRYDGGNRYDLIEELQERIARDRARPNEAIRCGNDAEAARQAVDLARDQRLLQEQIREVRGYQYPYTRPYTRMWSFSWGWR
jgi:hypothetical protein